jgi:DNA-binding CsgD family transcriptional regulator
MAIAGGIDRATGEALEALYDTATAADGWSRAAEAVGRSLGASAHSIFEFRPFMRVERAWVVGFDERILRRWGDEFAHADPKVPRDVLLSGAVYVENVTHARPRWYDRSEIENEVYAPAGVKYTCGLVVTRSNGPRWIAAFHRARDAGNFRPHEVQRFRGLVGHLRRAIDLGQRVAESGARARDLAGALERIGTGMVILARDGRIVEANAAARAMLARGDALASVSGRLQALDRTAQRALERAVAALPQRDEATGIPNAGDVIALPRVGGAAISARPLFARVVPIGIGSAAGHPLSASALVLLSDPEDRPRAPAHVLAGLFGLTPGEARVAQAAGTGLSPVDIAEQLAMTRESVRTYMKRVMAKTEVHSQAALVRLLSDVPSITDRPDP